MGTLSAERLRREIERVLPDAKKAFVDFGAKASDFTKSNIKQVAVFVFIALTDRYKIPLGMMTTAVKGSDAEEEFVEGLMKAYKDGRIHEALSVLSWVEGQ